MASLVTPLGRKLASTMQGHALGKGVPFRLIIGGRVFERITLDGAFVDLDGQPLYLEI